MIKMPAPNYNSKLTDIIIQLEHLRGRSISSTTSQQVFVQLKSLFHIIEALSSARIEGNHTTLAGFVEKRVQKDKSSQAKDESMKEIINLMQALDFIDEHIADTEIDKGFTLELHRIVVDGLTREGDSNAGNYRSSERSIAGSDHVLPSHYDIPDLMEELFDYINDEANSRDELLKIALTHHRFVWIHPFGNGNGRTVRLLTYAMLCKKGYIEPNVLRLFNPTAVFAGDRQKYYDMLERADKGTDKGLLGWCEYFLSGIKDETEKTLRLADSNFVNSKLLLPAVSRLNSAGVLTKLETSILERAIRKKTIRASDIADLWDKDVTSGAIANQIRRMREAGYLKAEKEGGREYSINFIDNQLTRLVLDQMENERLLPIRVDEMVSGENK
ncbi:MAG: Fic family protein [Candidatus Nomurabacteria bacterium]|nr:Fic family protein [Candidatus Saccharibacteria bacterium]USN95272.1 MAG: Fic family protein [Candidatus Nomurabacteria bacterium]